MSGSDVARTSASAQPLARLETEIALATLLERLPNLRLAIAEEDLYWRPIPIFRSLASLPVAWDA